MFEIASRRQPETRQSSIINSSKAIPPVEINLWPSINLFWWSWTSFLSRFGNFYFDKSVPLEKEAIRQNRKRFPTWLCLSVTRWHFETSVCILNLLSRKKTNLMKRKWWGILNTTMKKFFWMTRITLHRISPWLGVENLFRRHHLFFLPNCIDKAIKIKAWIPPKWVRKFIGDKRDNNDATTLQHVLVECHQLSEIKRHCKGSLTA